MSIETPALPYDFADLEPGMSRDAVVFHFLRHQRVCFDRMRALAQDTGLGALALEDLIRVTEASPAHRALYRYAAEVWNHNAYWRSMRPRGGGAAHGLIAAALAERFGSFERFTHKLKAAASAHFGSGWLWLVWRGGTVEILVTHDATTPLTRGDTVLLALDLWEHAYYLDHQNRRAAYVTGFLEELVSWEFANSMLAGLTRVPDGAAQWTRRPAGVRAERGAAGMPPPRA
ncbi:MAG TPA: Fe-Mn family superoxide dismutase [Steroidobacteraceae bacterium]|nr:Fe-Mn family superoxide dismutase [Steroidobacteraceae bacterium]